MIEESSLAALPSAKLLEIANKHISDKKPYEARLCLKILLARHPSNLELRFKNAWLLLFQDDVARVQAVTQCRDAILKIIDDFPEVKTDLKTHALIYLRLAECCNEVGPKVTALHLYQELAKTLGQPTLIYRSAEVLADLGRSITEILPLLEEAIKRDPKKHQIRDELVKSISTKTSLTSLEIKTIANLENSDGIYGNTIQGITVLKFPDNPHLGGNALEGDPASFAPSTWDFLINRFCISSVLDLGSGTGHAAEYFFRKRMKVIAVEGSLYNTVKSVYPTICHDLTKGPVLCQVDLVHCVELVEHIEKKYLKNIIDSLLCGKYIAMTAAHVGQGGHHHVNEQPNEYWISRLKNEGCDFLEGDTARLRELAHKEGCAWFATNGMIFVNRARQK